jgi:hypothetical protein
LRAAAIVPAQSAVPALPTSVALSRKSEGEQRHAGRPQPPFDASTICRLRRIQIT